MFVFYFGCLAVAFIVLGFITVIGMILNVRFLGYLKKNHYEKWVDMTSFGNVGPGMNNPGKFFSFVFNDAHLDDLKLVEHRGKLRQFYFYWITLMVGYFSILVFLTFLALLGLL